MRVPRTLLRYVIGDALLYTGLGFGANTYVQPIICLQRDAGTEANSLRVDWVDVTEGDQDLTSEFSISAANTITNASGTDTTGSKLEVLWEDAGADLTSEFSITAANTINNTGGTASTGHGVLVVWAEG